MEMIKLVTAALILYRHEADGLVYSINATEYERIPALYALEEYSACMAQEGGLYCVLDAELFSDEPSDLLRLIQEYSEYSLKHFNHSRIHRGVCASECEPACEDAGCTRAALQRCVNASVWREHALQVRVTDVRYCERAGAARGLDGAEIAMALVYLALLLLNAAGSYYDARLRGKNNGEAEREGNAYLLAFSVRRNWEKLTAGGGDEEPRKRSLRAIHGFRTMTMICVLFSHTVLIMAHAYIENPLYIEKAYDDPMKQILFNGSLVTQTFFVMSAFLLAYNYRLFAESRTCSLLYYPRGLLNRWLRLTPTYALVLGTICTWMRRVGSGPQWQLVVDSEAEACRKYWWSHLLYVNNYVYGNAFCMPQTWYLAADTQLFCFGLALGTAAWRLGGGARRVLLAAAALAGVLAPGLHTYLQDLDAVVLQSPESYRNLYDRDNTFRMVYARGHTNLAAHALGLIAGYLFYSCQKEGADLRRFKRYRWLVWAAFPAGVCFILTGGVFYVDGARAPLAARVLYAALYKPVFCTLVIIIMLGAFLRVEGVYRGVLEWRGWRVCGRVSYCAFLLHTLLQRGLVGSSARPTYMTDYYIMVVLAATVLLTYVLAVPLCLLVEMPLSHVQRALLEPPRRAAHAHSLAANVNLEHVDIPPLHSKL